MFFIIRSGPANTYYNDIAKCTRHIITAIVVIIVFVTLTNKKPGEHEAPGLSHLFGGLANTKDPLQQNIGLYADTRHIGDDQIAYLYKNVTDCVPPTIPPRCRDNIDIAA